MRRQALSLFEVLVSLLIISIGVLAVVALLPAGMKVQAQVRYQAYASAIALSLMDSFHNPIPSFTGIANQAFSIDHNSNNGSMVKPPQPGYGVRLRSGSLFSAPYQHDIERYLSGWITGVMPVPDEIARRLDSPGDEIQRILDEGGQLYYVDPSFIRGLSMSESENAVMNFNLATPEVHKLVFAVSGSAQQNALSVHPWESWPFYEVYPFPPQYVEASRAQGRKMVYGSAPAKTYTDGGKTKDTLATSMVDKVGDNTGRYHGRNWFYFRGTLGGPWSTGWDAFLRLTSDWERGANDVFTSVPLVTFEQLPRKMRGGWLPIKASLSQFGSYWDPPIDPAVPKNDTNCDPPGRDGTVFFPTYAMRLNYLDRAVYLWNQVKPPSVPAVTSIDQPILAHPAGLFSADDKRPPGGVMLEYTYAPDTLENYFTSLAGVSDPVNLPAGEFPPHPAQVLALSYLAHAAMMVTGYKAPFEAPTYSGPGNPTPSSTWKSFTPLDWDAAKQVPFHPSAGPIADGQPPYWPLLAIPSGSWPNSATQFDALQQKYRHIARMAHEMSLRWAIRYARECPYDWGAPRPANSQTMIDKPLALFDLFYDGGRTTGAGVFDTATNGQAQRVLRNLGSDTDPNHESFYRWMGPPNRTRFNVHAPNEVSHLGPNGHHPDSNPNWPTAIWESISRNPQLRSPPPVNPAYASGDDERYWLNRPFDPAWRGRQLVFWAVGWKSYADSETAPSAPVDISKHVRWRSLNGNLDRIDDNTTRAPMSSHPECLLLWTSAARDTRLDKGSANDDPDIELGHWGADRNGNRRCDRGPVPATVRMRAESVARFAVYDPVLRLGLMP